MARGKFHKISKKSRKKQWFDMQKLTIVLGLLFFLAGVGIYTVIQYKSTSVLGISTKSTSLCNPLSSNLSSHYPCDAKRIPNARCTTFQYPAASSNYQKDCKRFNTPSTIYVQSPLATGIRARIFAWEYMCYDNCKDAHVDALTCDSRVLPGEYYLNNACLPVKKFTCVYDYGKAPGKNQLAGSFDGSTPTSLGIYCPSNDYCHVFDNGLPYATNTTTQICHPNPTKFTCVHDYGKAHGKNQLADYNNGNPIPLNIYCSTNYYCHVTNGKLPYATNTTTQICHPN